MNSKRKGKTGELEAAKELSRVLGTCYRRGCQHKGGCDSPDIECSELPGLHVEVKRTERLNLYDALAQAVTDCDELRQVPVVMHRKSRKPWVLIVRADDLLRLLDVIDEQRAKLCTE